MGVGLTGWRLHVGVIFPTPIPLRAARERYEVMPDALSGACARASLRQKTGI